jgi:hypothetical protein
MTGLVPDNAALQKGANSASLLIAGWLEHATGSRLKVGGKYNGKIDRPRLARRPLQREAMDSPKPVDVSSYYRRMPDSFDSRVASIFEGIEADELLGNFGLVGGGAAGLELDIYDTGLGTPPHATSSPLFLDLPPVLPVLQWHGAAVERVPDGGVVLASDAHCAIQSFSFANIAYGEQYHMEPTECTIQEWGQIPEYRKSLEQIAGTDGASRLEQKTIERIDDFRQYSGILHRNFPRIVEPRRFTR